VGSVAKGIWGAILADRLFGRAAELGFYFLFALFPTLSAPVRSSVSLLNPPASFTTSF